MKRSRLPLTALRSFEAAGRLESVTLAARELFVSQAAVSRQIRDLETLLGRRLFERHHRQIRLTAEGGELLAVLTGAFDAIGDGLDGISDRGEGGEVRLSVEPSFASGWLVGALGGFRAAHPNIDVVVESSSNLTEFRSKDAELAIRFSLSHRQWPRTQARWLYDVVMAPFASPALFERGWTAIGRAGTWPPQPVARGQQVSLGRMVPGSRCGAGFGASRAGSR